MAHKEGGQKTARTISRMTLLRYCISAKPLLRCPEIVLNCKLLLAWRAPFRRADTAHKSQASTRCLEKENQ
eukprot:5993898-Amphidinium_carterae.6